LIQRIALEHWPETRELITRYVVFWNRIRASCYYNGV